MTVESRTLYGTDWLDGWSGSKRRSLDADSYLQRFTPRRTQGTMSPRNQRVAARLAAEGKMTALGHAALGVAPEP